MAGNTGRNMTRVLVVEIIKIWNFSEKKFLRDLLKCEHRNGRVIEWLDQPNGVFKIIKPADVANLWGFQKSNKIGMKYSDMARGIR